MSHVGLSFSASPFPFPFSLSPSVSRVRTTDEWRSPLPHLSSILFSSEPSPSSSGTLQLRSDHPQCVSVKELLGFASAGDGPLRLLWGNVISYQRLMLWGENPRSLMSWTGRFWLDRWSLLLWQWRIGCSISLLLFPWSSTLSFSPKSPLLGNRAVLLFSFCVKRSCLAIIGSVNDVHLESVLELYFICFNY